MTNRITPYEEGWLSMLVARGIATEDEARAAMHRVAKAALEELEERKEAERWIKKRFKKRRKRDE